MTLIGRLAPRSSCSVAFAVCAWAIVPLAAAAAQWTVPDSAVTEKSPLTATPQVLKKGQSLFASHCRKCHGPEGKGDGPDGDHEHPPADLTLAVRAAANPDGIMFYKIWNGRKGPDMPAFKSQLTKDQIWTLVEYVKSLRKPAEPTS